jgi:hypothetical protein
LFSKLIGGILIYFFKKMKEKPMIEIKEIKEKEKVMESIKIVKEMFEKYK